MRLVLVPLLLATLAAPCAAGVWAIGPDGVPVEAGWVLADGVKDPLFALMLGVIDADLYGVVSQAEVDSIVTAEGGSKLPYQVFTRMRRRPASDGADSYVEIQLAEAVDRPIPYSLLGYNPGSIRSSQRLDFLHFAVGRRSYLVEMDDAEQEITIENANLFVIAEGFMEMDFDGWLDRLLGSKLDDMQVMAFLTFQWKDQRYSLGMGMNNKGRGKTGAFDFVADETLFPAPKELLVVGREMREEGLRRLQEWRDRRAASSATPGAPGS
jgi:hypothetical protein